MVMRACKSWNYATIMIMLPMLLALVMPSYQSHTSARISITSNAATSAASAAPAAPAERGINFTTYCSYEVLTQYLKWVAHEYPHLAELYSVGVTYEGRELWALKVSDFPTREEEGEPELLYIGMHHAREWITHEVLLYFIDYLINNYGKDPQITFIVDNRELWIIPMLNPDGYVYDGNGDLSQTKHWRKNREPNWDRSYGTDLNRNYGWHWGELGVVSYFNPRADDYPGPIDKKNDDGDFRINEDNMDGVDNDRDGKVDEDTRGGFTTAETCAIRELATRHKFVICLSYHSYGEVIFWPWMYTRKLPQDEQLFKHIARGMAQYNGYWYRNYTEEDTHRKGPLICGDLNDYLYGAHGVLSYCIEVGSEDVGFYPPEELIEPLCVQNLMPNVYVAEIADNLWGQYFIIRHTPLENMSSKLDYYEVRTIVESPHGQELRKGGLRVYYSTDGRRFQWVEMQPVSSPAGPGASGASGTEFLAKLPAQSPGTTISYYIAATDIFNRTTLLPRYAPYQVFSFTVIPQPHVSRALLALHGLFMLAALIIFGLAALLALVHLRRKVRLAFTVKATMLGITALFLGGFVLGGIVAYQRFGTPWSGFPLGFDLTDNLTLLLFILWLLPLLLIRKTVHTSVKTLGRYFDRGFKACPHRNRISEKAFATAIVLLFLLTLTIFLLLPHGGG